MIADPTLLTQFYDMVAPTFKIDTGYAVFFDEAENKTWLLKFPELKKSEVSAFKGVPFITGRGELLLLDSESNKVGVTSENQQDITLTEYTPDLFEKGLYYFFIDPDHFILDGKLFTLNNTRVEEVSAVNWYDQKFGSNLKMIDSSRLDAKANQKFVPISCEDLFADEVAPYQYGSAILTETELPCLTAAFERVYWDSRRELLVFVNSLTARYPSSYLVVTTDLNRANTQTLRTTISDIYAETEFEYLETISQSWKQYFSSFPRGRYSFSLLESSLNEHQYLDSELGSYPMLLSTVDRDPKDPNDTQYLQVTPTIAIYGRRYCSLPGINECRGKRDYFEFVTLSATTFLDRDDAALVSANSEAAFFITENGLEKVSY